jgi:hypothetical protein
MLKSMSRLATAAAVASIAVAGTPALASALPADLRSPDAQVQSHPAAAADAAPINAPGATAADSASQKPLPSAPVWPVNPVPIVTHHAVAASNDDGVDWTTIALGVAGSLLAVGGIAFMSNRSRTRRTPRLRTSS